MANEGLHEELSDLSEETRDMHRAIVSLMEELEAVDWYNQRVDAAKDDELKAILAHNRDEEKEHASMLLEWIRRKDSSFRQGASGLPVQRQANRKRRRGAPWMRWVHVPVFAKPEAGYRSLFAGAGALGSRG